MDRLPFFVAGRIWCLFSFPFSPQHRNRLHPESGNHHRRKSFQQEYVELDLSLLRSCSAIFAETEFILRCLISDIRSLISTSEPRTFTKRHGAFAYRIRRP